MLNKSNKTNELMRVTVEKIVANGFGLAFADNLTIFVSLAVLGDELIVKIKQRKGKIAFAEIVEILQPSEFRIQPQCQYFGKCGGCDFQQMSYPAQLEAKKQMLSDSLRRIGKIDWQKPIFVHSSPKEFNYRTRTRFHLDSRKRKLGYYRRNSNEVFDIEECPILDESLQIEFSKLRNEIGFEEIWAEILEIETSYSGREISVFADELMSETKEIFVEMNGFRYFYNANTFFQGNLSLLPELINSALTDLNGNIALDLYCGIGLFTLPLGKNFKKVLGVEANETSVEFAKKNAVSSQLENIEFFQQETRDFLEENKNLKADVVLLDPPRSGTEPEVIELICQTEAQKIVYVSCDPATLARDLKKFSERRYHIENIEIFDLFPQTHHLETVVKLSLN